MLSELDVLEKINAGESSGVEFKQVWITSQKMQPHPDGLSDEIAAFANHQGGVIIFGIADKTKQMMGVDHADAKIF